MMVRGLAKRIAPLCLAVAGLLLAVSGRTESFPARPLRIIVPAAAGGNLDLVSRNIA